MPGIARRLARQYVPLRLRRAVFILRTGSPGSSGRSGARRPAGANRASRAATTASPPEQHAPLVESLRTGQSLTDAVLAQVRALLEAGDPNAAASVAASLQRRGETAQVGALACAVVAHDRGFLELAWSWFRDVEAPARWSHAAKEYVRSGLAVDRPAVLADVRRLLAEDPDSVGPQVWTDVIGPIYGIGSSELARDVFTVLDRQLGAAEDPPEDLLVTRDWMRRWIDARPDAPDAEPVPSGHVSFAIMDYGHPGRSRASANIGDHVQSLASLGHLVRHQDLRFHGRQELVDLLQQLHGRVRPELQLDGIAADVDAITVDRDASMYAAVPPNTWMLAFGWFMHPLFGMRHGFPFHHNLQPIFISFHCNKRALLTPEALDYLRRHGPIGCRDWTTVDLLLSVDVPAFFSGCMTTTVNTVFPDLPEGPPADGPVGYIDVPDALVRPGGVRYKHSNDAIRFRSFVTNVYDALARLETYRREHPALVTSRLHAWLPSRSIGVPVDFQPKNRSDIRFAGLIDTTDAEFDRIRTGLDELIRPVMSAILSGGSRDEVYRLWNEITADHVAAARARRALPAHPEPVPAGIEPDVARAVAATTDRGPGTAEAGDAVHVVVHLPAGRKRALGVLLASLAENAGRSVHVWLLSREPEKVDLDELAASLPALTFGLVPTRGIGDDLRRGDGKKVVHRDLDLLLLPDLLPSVPRVVLLPVDSLVNDDVARLAMLDLAGRPFAAPAVTGTRGTSGFGVIHSAGLRLQAKTVAATELRRRAHARHAFDFDAFGTDVLVLDLEQLRAEGFTTEYLPYVEEFGLTWREILHLAAGPQHGVVEERWAWVPTRSVADDPALVHWADPVKPWSDGYVPEQDRWLAAEQRWRKR